MSPLLGKRSDTLQPFSAYIRDSSTIGLRNTSVGFTKQMCLGNDLDIGTTD